MARPIILSVCGLPMALAGNKNLLHTEFLQRAGIFLPAIYIRITDQNMEIGIDSFASTGELENPLDAEGNFNA
jgi:hypothetical protein